MPRPPRGKLVRRQNEHIARELGISLDTLDLHFFRVIDAGLGHDPPRWRLLWQTSPPEGVVTHGSGDHLWSEIIAFSDPQRTRINE